MLSPCTIEVEVTHSLAPPGSRSIRNIPGGREAASKEGNQGGKTRLALDFQTPR